jgi:hypothetical protein
MQLLLLSDGQPLRSPVCTANENTNLFLGSESLRGYTETPKKTAASDSSLLLKENLP